MPLDFPNFSAQGYSAKRILGRNQEGGRITYLCHDLQRDRFVVLKHFRFLQSDSDWSDHSALEQEIQILQTLNHSGIPRYLDSFATPEGLCLVQEYKKAPSLTQPRTFDPDQIKDIAISILEILVYLQEQVPTIIHRDLKPDNILVDYNNTAYLVDFGFSRIGGEEVTGSSVIKGTPGFMPPEQLWGRLTRASDLYSLGMTLICLLSGVKSSQIGHHIDDLQRINVDQLLPDLNFQFKVWLTQMVQPKAQDRFPSAKAALAALRPIPIESVSLDFSTTRMRLVRFLTLKQTVSSLLLGLVVGFCWGITNAVPMAGLGVGLLLGLGLSLMLTIPRTSTEFLAVPPKQAIAGALLLGLSISALIMPVWVTHLSQAIGIDVWRHNHTRVDQGPGFNLYTDTPNTKADLRYTAFLSEFRQEVAQTLFDPGPESCVADIHLLHQDKNYFAVANRFGIRTPYGFISRYRGQPPRIVVRAESGLGTLTHQMMYHYLDCSYPEGIPSWAAQGAASFVEKFIAVEEDGQLNFSWGYRSNWRDAEIRPFFKNIDLISELRKGKDQSVFNAFFLFLHHEQQLVPLLNRLHGERGDGTDRLGELFNNETAYEVAGRWKAWMATDSLNLPMVESSFMAWETEAEQVKHFLNQFMIWDEDKQIWVMRQYHPDTAIPMLPRILAHGKMVQMN